MMKPNRPYRVIVVGAGLAGLGAAYELTKHSNYQVTVVEQRDRVGGRVHALPVGGTPVDFGGFIIYPWYKQFHRILKELHLTKALQPIPLQDIYYQLETDGTYYRHNDIPFNRKDTALLALKMVKPVFESRNVAAPALDSFAYMTGAEYFRQALNRPQHAGLYETFTDTVNQGYCYPGAERFKMAFMAPFIFKSRFQGDVTSAFFIPTGNQAVPAALANAIQQAGGQLQLQTTVKSCSGTVLKTTAGTLSADAIIFAQNISLPLYQTILPDVDIQCGYTQYYTVTIQCSAQPVVAGDAQWGAAFYRPNQAPLQVVSAVHLPTLYGPAVAGYVNLNIVCRDARQSALSADELLKKLQPQLRQLFPDVHVQRLCNVVYWPQTMPIADERFVGTLRQRQGKLGHYFAGDWLGAPSMETALTTGVQAAEQLIADTSVMYNKTTPLSGVRT